MEEIEQKLSEWTKIIFQTMVIFVFWIFAMGIGLGYSISSQSSTLLLSTVISLALSAYGSYQYLNRLNLFDQYEKYKPLILSLFQSQSIQRLCGLNNESNEDTMEIFSKKTAIIRYFYRGKKYFLMVPFQKSRNRDKVYLSFDSQDEIIDLDSDPIEKYQKYGFNLVEEEGKYYVNVTQQAGMPYLLTPSDFKADKIEIRDILGDRIQEYQGDETINYFD